MRVEARHPAGEWLPLSPRRASSCAANALSMALDAPNVASIDHPLTFSFSVLVRACAQRRAGAIRHHSRSARPSSRLMIVEESEGYAILVEKVIAALTASAAGLIVVTSAARGESRKISTLCIPSYVMGLLRVAANEQPGTAVCRQSIRRKHRRNAASRVERSLTITALARRNGDTLWLPSLSPNTR